MYDHLQTVEGSQTPTRCGRVSGEAAWQGRRSGASATAAGGLQGLQALSPRRWLPLGAFIKLPAERVVHDFRGRLTPWQPMV
jgi:hypothetical protein